MASASAPLDDIVQEARRLLAVADSEDSPLWLIGGIAIHLHANRRYPALERSYQDIDLVALKGGNRTLNRLMDEMGYERDIVFNASNPHHRLLYRDPVHERQVDVFVGSFEMCHRIPISDRLVKGQSTVPLAELLLTKMQVVELNEKDQGDIIALFADHDVGPSDDEMINAEHIAQLLARDWGLWRTIQLNLGRTTEALGRYDLGEETQTRALDRIGRLGDRIEAEPKSRAWRMRARIGDRKRWYELPEDT
jgi:hypothetical protein